MKILLVQMTVLAAAGWLGSVVSDRLRLGRLAGAMAAGLVLSVSVAGHVWPAGYRVVFNGGQQAVRIDRALSAWRTGRAQGHEKLQASGVSDVAVIEFDRQTAERERALKEQLAGAEAPYRQTRMFLWYGCALWWLIAGGFGVGLGRLRHDLLEAMPLAIGAAVMVAAVGLAIVGLLGRAWPEYLTAAHIPFDWRGAIGLLIVGGCAALPAGNAMMHRLGREGSPLDDLPHLAAATAAWLTLGALGALAVVGYEWRLGQAGGRTVEAMGRNVGLVVAVTVIVLGAVGPALRWLMRRWSDEKAAGLCRVVVGLAIATPLVVRANLHPLWLALMVPLGLSWSAPDRRADGRDRPAERWGLAGVIVATGAMMHFDTLGHVHWLMVLVALSVLGDSKALGVMAAARWLGRRSWGQAFELGLVLSAGGPTMVIVAEALHRCGMLNAVQYASVLWAVAILAAMCRPMLALTERFGWAK